MTATTDHLLNQLLQFGDSVALGHYDLNSRFPHPADELLDMAWELLPSVPETDAAALRRSVDLSLAAKLMAYCRRMAVIALRERQEKSIAKGLYSISLDNDLLDIRDVFRAVVLHFDVCRKVGFSFGELSQVGLRLSTETRRDRIASQFLRGPDYTKSLQAMKFTLVETDDGPLYIDGLFDWP